jgi:PAP2 superfamily
MVKNLLPRGARDLLWQIVLFCGAYWLYRLVRGQVFDQDAEAFNHAHDIVSLEKSLHVFSEPSIQDWAIRSGFVDSVGSWMYINTHFIVTTCTLAFIYLFRNEHFYFVRNMFMVAMGLALIGYVALPTAPPRMLTGYGFHDSVAAFTGVDADSGSASVLFNPYAAIPSMHVAFSLMLGVTMARMTRRRWARALWFAYCPVITFVVIATANHWWIDGFLGASVAAVSAVAARELFARARPEVWAWNARSEPALP